MPNSFSRYAALSPNSRALRAKSAGIETRSTESVTVKMLSSQCRFPAPFHRLWLDNGTAGRQRSINFFEHPFNSIRNRHAVTHQEAQQAYSFVQGLILQDDPRGMDFTRFITPNRLGFTLIADPNFIAVLRCGETNRRIAIAQFCRAFRIGGSL